MWKSLCACVLLVMVSYSCLLLRPRSRLLFTYDSNFRWNHYNHYNCLLHSPKKVLKLNRATQASATSGRELRGLFGIYIYNPQCSPMGISRPLRSSAVDEEAGIKVAVRRTSPFNHTLTCRQAFRETMILKRLKHKNVCQPNVCMCQYPIINHSLLLFTDN